MISSKNIRESVSTSYTVHQVLVGQPSIDSSKGPRVKYNMDKEHDSSYVRVRLKRTARPKLQETAEGLLYGVDVSTVT